MLEALRGLGYSPSTALADIIDNSIAARATNVHVSFDWRNFESRIIVFDDGEGMDEAQLDRAMRLGESNPLDKRSAHDLGRFGLGLKTASFSQCRRLTVAAKRESQIASLHWDLDILANSSDGTWQLLEGPAPGTDDLIARLENTSSGTVVIWEHLDRIVTPGFSGQDFLDMIDNVERHLAMVFHRFLSGQRPRLRIIVNGRNIVPWDPFLLTEPATWRSPVEKLMTEQGSIEVQCFVLPHKDKLDLKTYETSAGPDGWTAQQGFYVYRNQRLLVAGGWLGLGPSRSWTKEEAHRLARIRLDIPNTADAAWKIDIRKSTARPPVTIRDRLSKLAEDTRTRARRVFAHRGSHTGIAHAPITTAWISVRTEESVRYRIDDNHPAVQMVMDKAGELMPAIKAMLRVIEETVPVQRIWLDTAESKETPRTCFSTSPPEEISEVLGVIYRNLIERKGLSAQQARDRLLATEPFNQHPELVAALPDSLVATE